MLNAEIAEDKLERSLPVLHLKIRTMELSFHVAVKLEMNVKQWRGVILKTSIKY